MVSLMFVGRLGELELASASVGISLYNATGYFMMLGLVGAMVSSSIEFISMLEKSVYLSAYLSLSTGLMVQYSCYDNGKLIREYMFGAGMLPRINQLGSGVVLLSFSHKFARLICRGRANV
jgi:hypothetical protein